MFNWSEVHLSEVPSYKIYTLVIQNENNKKSMILLELNSSQLSKWANKCSFTLSNVPKHAYLNSFKRFEKCSLQKHLTSMIVKPGSKRQHGRYLCSPTTFTQRLDFLRQSSLGLLTWWDLSQALRLYEVRGSMIPLQGRRKV